MRRVKVKAVRADDASVVVVVAVVVVVRAALTARQMARVATRLTRHARATPPMLVMRNQGQ